MAEREPNGELFGTLCGLDSALQSDELMLHAPWLEILAMLLSAILVVDLERTRQARALGRAEMAAESRGRLLMHSTSRPVTADVEPRPS